MVAVPQQQTKRKNKRQSWREKDARKGKTVQTASVMLAIYMACRVVQMEERMNDIWAKEDPQRKLALMPEVIYHL